MLSIHVRILVKVGEEARVAAAITEATPLFRQEEGNLVYEPSQSTADPCVFFCAERWADQAALDRHAASTASQRLRTAIGPAMEAIERHTLRLLGD